jgi:hypothetical protein
MEVKKKYVILLTCHMYKRLPYVMEPIENKTFS